MVKRIARISALGLMLMATAVKAGEPVLPDFVFVGIADGVRVTSQRTIAVVDYANPLTKVTLSVDETEYVLMPCPASTEGESAFCHTLDPAALAAGAHTLTAVGQYSKLVKPKVISLTFYVK